MEQIYERLRRLPRAWMVLGLLLVSSLFLFFVFSGDHEYKRDFSIRRTNSYIEGLKIVSKKDGSDLWVMTARKADFTKDETLATMDSVFMDIKKEGVLVNADRGTYHMDSKDLRLEDNVMIRTKDAVIRAASLTWNPSGGMLTTDSKIRMESNKCNVEGEGLTATEDNRVTLMRNVKATFF